jgi:hypothetical protein
MNSLPSFPWLLAVALTARAAAPVPLEESVVIEAVNDVTHIAMPAGRAGPVTVRAHLRSPDRLRTGRQSRAELEAPDGTITRLGANTTFAFDAATRSLELKSGSLLFHSPSGRGGGTIRSTSASAAVLGTTIIAAATLDGGFKLLVLEGRAQVDFTAGAPLQLDAGQMTFIRPAGGGAGAPGPVLHFDLAQQVKNSRLIQGFARPLPSRAKIEQAVVTQSKAVGQGQFLATGFLVFTATSDTQVNGIEAAGPDADDKLVGEFTTPQRLALNTGATLTSARLPEERLFRTPLLVPASESPFLNKESDVLVTGLLALNLTVSTPTLSLAGWNQPEFQFVGKHAITFTGSTRFTDLGGVDYLRIFSPQINVPAGAVLSADFPASARPTTFYFDADLDLAFTDGTVRNPSGGLILQSHAGALRISGETLIAGNPVGAATVVPSALNLDAPFGALTLTNSIVRTTGGGAAALARTVAISGTRFELDGGFWADATDSVQLDTLTWIGQPAGAIFQATAGTLISARALGFDGFREINLGARTLTLESVRFPAGATVRLVSEQGRLAPLPNTGQTVQPGFVNFVRDVSYAGRPAQDYVAPAAGGTGLQPPQITVGKPGS